MKHFSISEYIRMAEIEDLSLILDLNKENAENCKHNNKGIITPFR